MSTVNPRNEIAAPTEQASFWRKREKLLSLATILVVTFLVYLPNLKNGFVNWDDQIYVYKNPYITNLSGWGSLFETVKDIFTTHVMGNYNPLPILSFAIEKMVYGLDRPEWFHLTNIFLHLTCTLLVFQLSLSLGLKMLPAAFCALLFGIQPMRVESVAWVTERKDVLMGTFYFLALYYYVEAVKSSFRKRHLLIIPISFLLALLSKIQAVTLPLSMLLVDYYHGRPLGIKLVFEKWLYFMLSLATGLSGIYFLLQDGSFGSNVFFSFFERLFIGSYSYIVYIIKSILPYKLVPVYPYPTKLNWLFYASMVPLVSALGLICFLYVKKKKQLVFGLLFFTFNIMFLLQIFGAGQGFIADRFTYIAYFGLFFIYAYGFQCVLEKHRSSGVFVYTTAVLILGIYGFVNFEQNKIWKNGETLWTYVLEHYPDTSLNWENRAGYFHDEGRIKEALHDYDKAIVLRPDRAELYFRRGNLYFDSNNPDQWNLAIKDYTKAIILSPSTREYRTKRGTLYYKLKMPDRSLQDFNSAERMNPGDPFVYVSRAKIYFELDQYDKAQQDIETYLDFYPQDSSMWSNLGTVSRLNKHYSNSLDAFNRAIQIEPGKLDYYYKRFLTYYEMGDRQKARDDLSFLKSNGFEGINPALEEALTQRQ